MPETSRRNVVVHRLQPGHPHERLAAGATLVLDAVDELYGPLGGFAQDLERFTRTGVQINAYASWTPVEGFGVHWDDHDTVIVQLDGSKRRRLYGSTRTAPLHRDVAVPEPPPDTPITDLVLTAGDVLYVPRGWWHAVTADQGHPSLHITAGLQTRTGADLLAWIADNLRRDADFRRDLPVHAIPAEQIAHVERLGKLVLAEFTDPDLFGAYAASRDALYPGRMRPSLPHIGDVPADGTLAVRLTTARSHLRTDPVTDTTVLTANGKEFAFAAATEPMLRPLAEGRGATPAELAARADLGIADAAAVVTVLVAGQAATIAGSPT
ncbi:JmjC domain-containing protein [Embleya sp. NBC_00896]|uniref:JmjC domain-containing protein n=1 Tax=Embleya sp. NBC_00896 TaxID=2975961 RepID=UPI002F91AA0A